MFSKSSLDRKQAPDTERVLYSSYYRPDRYEALKGLPNIKCMFCERYSPVKFDLELHLYEAHRENLLYDLPIKKRKGYRMDNRIAYVIDLMESEALRNNRYFH